MKSAKISNSALLTLTQGPGGINNNNNNNTVTIIKVPCVTYPSTDTTLPPFSTISCDTYSTLFLACQNQHVAELESQNQLKEAGIVFRCGSGASGFETLHNFFLLRAQNKI
jgi:hypothetical protein